MLLKKRERLVGLRERGASAARKRHREVRQPHEHGPLRALSHLAPSDTSTIHDAVLPLRQYSRSSRKRGGPRPGAVIPETPTASSGTLKGRGRGSFADPYPGKPVPG